MNKKATFFIDDVIWVFRDLTRQRPASLWDNPYMATLKKAHDEYGVKTQLNVFYRTCFWYGDDEFSLADMTDAYKKEFEEASDWLKMGFHSKEEWPDYPFINADYGLVDRVFKLIYGEVCRFAGEKSFAKAVVPHWIPMSEEGIRALRDNGIRRTYASSGSKEEWSGDENALPYGHSFRLLHNKKPESGVYKVETTDLPFSDALCSYNHLEEEDYAKIDGKIATIKDKKYDVYYMPKCQVILNLIPGEELPGELSKYTDDEFINIGDHEQYFYPDYYAYQPYYAESILTMGRMLKEAGYTFMFMEDLPTESGC